MIIFYSSIFRFFKSLYAYGSSIKMLFSYEDHVNGQLNTITSRCFFFLKETVFTVNCFIRLSEKFLLFYEGIIDVQRLLFYIILSNYVRFILFFWDKHRDISRLYDDALL